MILCPHCHGASGSVDHEWCRTCKGTGALNQPCDRCGYRVASVAVGDGVYLCDVCAELTEESEGMEDE